MLAWLGSTGAESARIRESDKSGNLADMGVAAGLLGSIIPRWLRLKSPMPRVLTAGSFESADCPCVAIGAGSTSTLSSSLSSGSSRTGTGGCLLLLPPL